jgi:glycosyltransferase involved in cell wall biosynthesis
MSNIHSILVVKNEEDIIELCISEALRWSDFIYVYDGDSTDQTWTIVNALRSDRVIPYKQDGKVFREGLRAEVFEAYRHLASPGDWWCQLNADEFYIDDPKQFLSHVPQFCHVVWGMFVQYYLTDRDLNKRDSGESTRDRLEALRYYRADHAERRFFRHRPRLHWDANSAWPTHLGLSEPRLIRFKHYPYRSPEQIQMRLDIRRNNRARGFEGWEHAKEATWREKIVPANDLHLDTGNGQYIIEHSHLPDHVGTTSTRIVQRVLHGLRVWP